MPTIESTESRLRGAFDPGQARVLAEVIHESYDGLVHVSDFRELKAVVQDLAVAQHETQQELRELAVAQKEMKQEMQELAHAQREMAVAQKEMKQEMRDLAQAQQETKQELRELAAAQKETERVVQGLARQVGGLSEAFGGSIEAFAIDLVPDILEKYWGLTGAEASSEEFSVAGKSVHVDFVIRGFIEGRPVLVLGEAKSNVTGGEVERFMAQAQRIMSVVQEEVRIVFFGYRVNKEGREAIKAAGAYMIFSHGKLL